MLLNRRIDVRFQTSWQASMSLAVIAAAIGIVLGGIQFDTVHAEDSVSATDPSADTADSEDTSPLILNNNIGVTRMLNKNWSYNAVVRVARQAVSSSTVYDLDAKLLRGDPLGSVEEGDVTAIDGLSGSTVANSHGSFCIHQSTGADGGRVALGYVMRTYIEPADNKQIRLRLTLEHSTLQDESAQESVVLTSYKRYDRVVDNGDTLKLRFGKSADRDVWLELRVRERHP